MYIREEGEEILKKIIIGNAHSRIFQQSFKPLRLEREWILETFVSNFWTRSRVMMRLKCLKSQRQAWSDKPRQLHLFNYRYIRWYTNLFHNLFKLEWRRININASSNERFNRNWTLSRKFIRFLWGSHKEVSRLDCDWISIVIRCHIFHSTYSINRTYSGRLLSIPDLS